MHVSTPKILVVMALSAALCGHTQSAVAQDASLVSPAADRAAQIGPSSGIADDVGSGPAMTEGGTWASLKAYNSAVVGNAFILGRVPAQEGIEADTAPAPGLGSEAGSEPVFVESTEPPVARLVSGLNPGLRSPLLKQAAMANILADLRRNYGLENMAQSGSLSWSFAWQRSLASSKKTASLLACNKMSRWSSICASADTNTFSVYFRGS